MDEVGGGVQHLDGDAALEPIERGDATSHRRRDWRRLLITFGPILLIALGAIVLARVNTAKGHDLGDDWTLYIRQAKGLAQGNVSEVISDNTFTRRNSSAPSFTPPVYPWGYPILLAPFIALKGTFDVALFQKLQALLFGIFVFAWYWVLRRRVQQVVALALTLLFAVSPWYVEWARQVLSEFLYLILVAVAFWLIDRLRDRDEFEGERLRPLIILGLVIGYAFSTRREALALVPALMAAHVLYLHHHRDPGDADGRRSEPRVWVAVVGGVIAVVGFAQMLARALSTGPGSPVKGYALAALGTLIAHSSTWAHPGRRWSRLATPYLSAGGFVAGLQLALPSSFFKYEGSGTEQLVRWLTYKPFAGEMLGIRDNGLWRLFGATTSTDSSAALVLFKVFVVLTIAGMAIRLFTNPRLDAPLVVFLAADWWIVGIQPFGEERYLFVILPIAAYFAYQAVASLAQVVIISDRVSLRLLRRPGTIAATFGLIAMLPYVGGNAINMVQHTQNKLDRDRYSPDFISWGALDPTWTDMFDRVRRYVRSDEIVSFFRARTMNLYTDLHTIQLWDINQVMERADWLVEVALDNYSEPDVTPDQLHDLGFVLVDTNGMFNIWKVPPRPVPPELEPPSDDQPVDEPAPEDSLPIEGEAPAETDAPADSVAPDAVPTDSGPEQP